MSGTWVQLVHTARLTIEIIFSQFDKLARSARHTKILRIFGLAKDFASLQTFYWRQHTFSPISEDVNLLIFVPLSLTELPIACSRGLVNVSHAHF